MSDKYNPLCPCGKSPCGCREKCKEKAVFGKSTRSATHFPQNIYGVETVHPLPYYTRDIVNPCKHFEFIMYPGSKRRPHQAMPARWDWGMFPNGYGTGNFNLHNNCPKYCEEEPQGYVSEKTQRLINAYSCTQYV